MIRQTCYFLYFDIQEMCASIGVDPLASNKGFWSNMLDIGDFYYELGSDWFVGSAE